MPSRIKNSYGYISIEEEVIARISGLCAMECYGVVGMAAKSIKDGFVHLLKIESLTKGIKIWKESEKINIDLHVIVEYGTNILVISENIIDTVKYKVEDITGLKINSCNVYVEGLRVNE